jgi:hypothetical protein
MSSSRAYVLRRIACGSLLFVGAGFYFFMKLFENYLSFRRPYDVFYVSLAITACVVVVFAVVVFDLITAVVRRQWSVGRLACGLLFVASVMVSISAGSRIDIWADQLFLHLNSTRFSELVPGNRKWPVVLHSLESRNFYKFIVHFSANAGNGDAPSLEAIGSEIARQVLAVEGCKISTSSLKTDFYVVRAYC